MQDSFNPYRQWLGREDGLPPAGPRELLGLAEGQSDPETIAHAADILTARIRRIRPGPHLVEWQQLLDRIAAAKATLLAEAENRPEPTEAHGEQHRPLRSPRPPAHRPPSPPGRPCRSSGTSNARIPTRRCPRA